MLFSISAILNSTLSSSKASPASLACGSGLCVAGPARLWACAYCGAEFAPASACPARLNAFSTVCSGSRSLKRGLRLTVSDSVRLNSSMGGSLLATGTPGSFPVEQEGSMAWELGSVSGTAGSVLRCPEGLGRCLMVKLPSSAKGMHSLELFWEEEVETSALTSSSVSEQASSRLPSTASVMGALGSLNVRLRGLLLSKGSLLASES
ncbi:hypothetical protein N308_09445, partial [Struthio camelus australis]